MELGCRPHCQLKLDSWTNHGEHAKGKRFVMIWVSWVVLGDVKVLHS